MPIHNTISDSLNTTNWENGSYVSDRDSIIKMRENDPLFLGVDVVSDRRIHQIVGHPL